MDRKSTYLICLLALLGVVVAGWGYHTYFLERDFIVHTTTECDPETEACFMWCGDGECEQDYYKKIDKNARYIPVCDSYATECEPLSCGAGEADCKVTWCSSETIEDGEVCTDPSDFQEVGESADSGTNE
jgi:hypothetical protein